MKTREFLLLTIVLALTGIPALAADYPPVPGGGTPAAGGKGPGMGHDYRRNIGGPGLGQGGRPARPVHGAPETPGAAQPAAAAATPVPPTRPGYRSYPNWVPGMAPPYATGRPGQVTPRRQGYGYPGYRGRGWSPYPGHRQYGNPPGIPSGPPADR